MHYQQQSGFSLLEIVVSVAIAAIALLGLGAAQIKALQYATSSFHYTLAIVQANNAAERMWPYVCDLSHNNAYSAEFQASLQAQNNDYQLDLPTQFSSEFPITVSWQDERLDDGVPSQLRIFAQYPNVTTAECGL